MQRPYFSPEGYVFYKDLSKQTPIVASVIQESALALNAKCGRSPTLAEMKTIINNNAMFLKAVAIRTVALEGKGEPEELFGEYAISVSSISCTFLADATQ